MDRNHGISVLLLTMVSAQAWVCGQEIRQPPLINGVEPTTQAASKPSEMVVKDGLGVVMQLLKTQFTPDEPLVFKVTYKNTSASSIRLLDVGGQLNFWRLSLEDVVSGKMFTGHTTVLEGPDPVENGLLPVLLKPGQSVTKKLTIRRVYFVEGDVDLAQFRAAMEKSRQAGRQGVRGGQGGSPPPPNEPPLPEGTYKIVAEMSFERSPHFVSVRRDVAEEKVAVEADPLLWKSGPLVSKPFELSINRDAPPLGLSSETRQNAKDVLVLIEGWRQTHRQFLSQHADLNTNLNRLEAAATAAANDDGKDVAAGVERAADFSRRLPGGFLQARVILRNPSETEQAKSTASQIKDELLEIWNR